MLTVLEALNGALHEAMARDERVYLLGEDILDPYGGAFKVSRGLSQAFPERVLTTPISEAGFVGIGVGMALRGLRPVVEIMFGDFVTLAADQLINHAAKFRWMYGSPSGDEGRSQDPVCVPLVVRTPMGGRRGYGPTHSQTLEKLYLGVPGLRVLAPNAIGAPGELLLETILQTADPVLFVENKLLYLLPVADEKALGEFDIREVSTFSSLDTSPGREHIDMAPSPAYILSLRGAPPPELTITAYGYMAELACQAALRLAYEYEIFVELVVMTQLAPFAVEPILRSVERTGRLLVVEEGTLSLGWGAEIVALAAEHLGPRLTAVRRLAGRDLPIPASGPLEAAVLPGVDDVLAAAQEIIGS